MSVGRRRHAGFLVAVVALVAAGVLVTSSLAPAAPATRCEVEGPVQRTAARTYVLHVLAPEQIFTQAEAASRKPKRGELILRGTLPEGARAATSEQTHVSIHILDRRTGRAVWEPYPLRVRVRRATDKPPGRVLRVALMEGIGKGVCDRHYGTNVRLEPGERYTVTAALGGETISFSFNASTVHRGHSK